jgi:hypothetical protein
MTVLFQAPDCAGPTGEIRLSQPCDCVTEEERALPNKTATHASDKNSAAFSKPRRAPRASHPQSEQVNPAKAFARVQGLPSSELSASDILSLQGTAGNRAVQLMLGAKLSQADGPASSPANDHENTTGLPDKLKAGIEHLSGLSMDDVKVHYNSSKPASLNALAYTQGSDIHIRPNAEKHLPHEAWHVVQQKQGRVKATLQAKGVAINDDSALEHEADVMGVKAATRQMSNSKQSGSAGSNVGSARKNVTQLLSFSAALTDRNIAAPRTFTETDGGGQLALAGGTADLVVAGDVKESQNIGKALNQAADRFAEVGNKTNAILTAYGTGNFAPRAKPRAPNVLEPFIYRIKVPYKSGKKTNQIELDYQLANPFYGYVVRQKDTGDAAESVISGTGPANPTSTGQVTTFNAQHANTGPQALGTSLTQDSKKSKETNEARVDARAKLAGEGPRWMLVRNNYTTIADDSRIWTLHKDKVYSVSFRTLWLSWAAVFDYEFNIPDSVVADKLVKSTAWPDAPDVVKKNRWEAKSIDIKVHA